MTALCNYLENALYNHVLRNTPLTSPVTVYLGLFDADPGEDGSGGTEKTGLSGYARQAVTFGAPTDGAGSNSGAITFGPAGEAWATCAGVGLFDALTGGNPLMHAASTSRTIGNGDSYQIAIGDLDASFA